MLKPTPKAIKRHFRGGFALYFNRVTTPQTKFIFLVVLEHRPYRQRAEMAISGIEFCSKRAHGLEIIRVRSPF